MDNVSSNPSHSDKANEPIPVGNGTAETARLPKVEMSYIGG